MRAFHQVIPQWSTFVVQPNSANGFQARSSEKNQFGRAMRNASTEKGRQAGIRKIFCTAEGK